jgi:hypothetical protein
MLWKWEIWEEKKHPPPHEIQDFKRQLLKFYIAFIFCVLLFTKS